MKPIRHAAPRMNEGAPHWQAAKDGRLSVPHCTGCAKFAWPPRDRCSDCGGSLDWVDCAGTGSLVTWSVVRRAVDPALKDAVPYVVAIVDIDEGVRLFTNIVDADVASLRAGMRVACRFEPTVDDAAWVPVFAPRTSD